MIAGPPPSSAHLKSLYVLNELANGIRQVRRGEPISAARAPAEFLLDCFRPTCWSVIGGHRSRSTRNFVSLAPDARPSEALVRLYRRCDRCLSHVGRALIEMFDDVCAHGAAGRCNGPAQDEPHQTGQSAGGQSVARSRVCARFWASSRVTINAPPTVHHHRPIAGGISSLAFSNQRSRN